MTVLELNAYRVFIGNANQALFRFLSEQKYSQIAVLVDDHTRAHCLPLLEELLPPSCVVIQMPSGEKHKNLVTCRHVWEEMLHYGMDRKSLLINLGGGVVGDLGGFCAATYMRGIDFIQVPTSLLAQVDASIGGKLGIDFNFIKNSIGVFQDPQMVVVDPRFLETLPSEEIRSGFAEILKHALISEVSLWNEILGLEDLKDVNWSRLLARSLRIKQVIVEQDPFEKGLRKALNFGHTVGHAIESFSLRNGNHLLHGEAIAIGILAESWLSHQLVGLPADSLGQINRYIRKLYPPYLFQEADIPVIMDFMRKDKKNHEGQICFSLLPGIGRVEVDVIAEEELIRESLTYYLRGMPS